jgi:CMP-N,N'-diacetyllegionaminic acid synthase
MTGGPPIALIAARGGSKGLPGKNLAPFCGRPLLEWSIEQALDAEPVDSVWVTSDDEQILEAAEAAGATGIERPAALADDHSSSEDAWIHALDEIERRGVRPGLVCALQATSPLREPADIERGVADFQEQGCDSLFSAAELHDFLIWRRDGARFESVNYDHESRGHRHERTPWYVENGSFYIFTPDSIRAHGNRLAGRIGVTLMELWKSFEIDHPEDLKVCELLMRSYILEPA